MSVKRQIILIPYWVEEALRRNRLPMATCLDFPKLRSVLSLNDLVAFIALQGMWPQLTGMRDCNMGSLVLHWFSQVRSNSEQLADLSNNVLPLEENETIRKDLRARLFEGSARQEHYKEPFNSYDLTPEFAGAVVYPGFFGGNCTSNVQQCLNFVRAMLKTLYVYEPHNEVAKTPLFLRYLSLLPR